MAERTVVLVVNRERILVDLLVRSLENDGLAMFGASSISAACRIFELHRPDLIIIDPALDGALDFIAGCQDGLKPPRVVALLDPDAPVASAVRDLGAYGVSETADVSGGLDSLVAAIRRSIGGVTVGSGGDRTRILIVDDEDGMRETLADYLSGRGYQVVLARDGAEAVEAVRRDPVLTLVLLDVSMPRMGGLEALGQIMEQSTHPDVIMMTAVADREIARGALAAGAFDYVLKPFDLQSLDASITACLSYTDYHRQPWWKRLIRRTA